MCWNGSSASTSLAEPHPYQPLKAPDMRKLIRAEDLATERFGRWTVTGPGPDRVSPGGTRRPTLNVKCDCGTVRSVSVATLKNGESKSCGCLHKEIQAARFGAYATTHALTGTGAWNSWTAMKSRCTNPKNKAFKHYGGRGIQFCERWGSFKNFLTDMGDRPEGKTLDRKDVNGNYTPSNCKWSTQSEQCINRRGITAYKINGENLTIRQWSERLAVSITTLKARLSRNWPLDRVFSPLHQNDTHHPRRRGCSA